MTKSNNEKDNKNISPQRQDGRTIDTSANGTSVSSLTQTTGARTSYTVTPPLSARTVSKGDDIPVARPKSSQSGSSKPRVVSRKVGKSAHEKDGSLTGESLVSPRSTAKRVTTTTMGRHASSGDSQPVSLRNSKRSVRSTAYSYTERSSNKSAGKSTAADSLDDSFLADDALPMLDSKPKPFTVNAVTGEYDDRESQRSRVSAPGAIAVAGINDCDPTDDYINSAIPTQRPERVGTAYLVEASLVQSRSQHSEEEAPAPLEVASGGGGSHGSSSGVLVKADPVSTASVWLTPKKIAVIAISLLVIFGVLIGVLLGGNRKSGNDADKSTAEENSAPGGPTPSPTMFNLQDFVQNNLPVNTQEAILISDLPQARALDFLESDPLVGSYPLHRRLQRFSLATLYYATEGEERWNPSEGWVTETDECTWHTEGTSGLVCDRDGNFQALNLNFIGLSGELPNEINLLSSLISIRLGHNFLTGTLPSFEKLTGLETISIVDSELIGPIPRTFGGLARLRGLFLNENFLTGQLPPDLFANKTFLRDLDLESNELTGVIPAEISQLRSIQRLYLDGNFFFGEIPVEICSLTNLEILSLSSNEFETSIPSCLGNLENLRELHLDGYTDKNSSSGEIPDTLCSLTNLQHLTLSGNNFEKSIPSCLGELEDLFQLSLEGNSLTGSVPDSLCELKEQGGDFDIFIDCELVSCSCDCVCGTEAPTVAPTISSKAPSFVPTQSNSPVLSPSLPVTPSFPTESQTGSPVTAGVSSTTQLTTGTNSPAVSPNSPVAVPKATSSPVMANSPTTATTNAPVPDANPPVSGPNSPVAATSAPIPVSITEPTAGATTNLPTAFPISQPTPQPSRSATLPPTQRPTDRPALDSFLSSLPSSTRTSIQTSSSAQGRAYAWLEQDTNVNTYTASRLLQRFVLAVIYFSFGGANWTNKSGWLSNQNECNWYIDTLSGEDSMCETGNVLIGIGLRDNNLEGMIPDEVGLLSELRVLDLCGNAISSSIPTALGGLTAVTFFDVANNVITGKIPSQMGLLTKIETLYMESNDLTGQLPTELGLLTSLVALDFSDNQLEGTIPTSFSRLSDLGEFRATKNDLTGLPPTSLLRALSKASVVDFGNNTFEGTLPTHFGLLQRVSTLDVFANRFSGTIPTELGGLGNVENLYLENNSFSGLIPTELGMLSPSTQVFLHDNPSLQGSVPDELCAAISQGLYLSVDCGVVECTCGCACFDDDDANTITADDDNCGGDDDSCLLVDDDDTIV